MRNEHVANSFVRFALVGGVGFVIDAFVLYVVIGSLGLGPYVARVISYIVAATSTWWLNREFTFRIADRRAPHRQWARYLAVNGLGGFVNYLVYAACLPLMGGLTLAPLIAVAIGSCAGLIFNFTLSKRLVFALGVSGGVAGRDRIGHDEPLR
jgi:putative flippase GtrA